MKKSVPRKKKMSKAKKRAALCGYLFAAPWIIGFLAFTLYPMLSSLYYSFTNYNLANQADWIGLTNYEIIFTSDKLIPIAVYNTLYYAILSVPLTLIIGLSIAMLLNQKVKGIGLIRTIYYLPNVISVVATTMLWQFIFQNNGLLNSFLGLFGIDGPGWLTDPSVSKITLVLMDTWNAGGAMIIYLAGLQGIPRRYYEAADIDGAGSIRKFFSITLPLLMPSILFNLIMGIIGSLQTFSQSFIMTNGGPANSTMFYMLALYKRAFSDMQMGYACAMAWVFLIPTVLITLLVFKLLGNKVHYETN